MNAGVSDETLIGSPFTLLSEFGRPGALTVIVPTAEEALRRAECLIESGAREVRIRDDADRVYDLEELAAKLADGGVAVDREHSASGFGSWLLRWFVGGVRS